MTRNRSHFVGAIRIAATCAAALLVFFRHAEDDRATRFVLLPSPCLRLSASEPDVAHVALSVVVHVAPEGKDTGDGSAAQPVATLRSAQERVREMLRRNPNLSIRVQLAPGEYVLDKPVIFSPEDSGPTTDRPIIYEAATAGTVRFSGGRRITGWKVERQQWVTHVRLEGTPDAAKNRGEFIRPFRDLWANDRRAIRARSPNGETFRIERAGPDDRKSIFVRESDQLSIANPRNSQVVFLHDWSTSRVRLASIDPRERVYRLQDPIGPNARIFTISHFEAHPRYFVENASELLDAPGEWFLDNSTGELRYIPRKGESPEAAKVFAPVTQQLVIFRGAGRGEKSTVRNIQFRGISFAYTRFDIPSHGYAATQACFHERRTKPAEGGTVAMPAAVQLDDTKSCRFENCEFIHLGGGGVHVRANCNGVVFEHCLFRDIAGNGVMIGETFTRREPSSSEKPIARTAGIAISNCTIEQCGATFFGAVGVWIGIASATVEQNEIRDLPYTGVSVGWKWDDSPTGCSGNTIRRNHIHHVMQTLSDGAGIYTLGRQPATMLSENVIHDIPKNAGRAESNGIFMDEGSTEITVRNNTIYKTSRSPIRFHKAGAIRIVANRLVSKPGVPVFRFNACSREDKTFDRNEEIESQHWSPPAGDAGVSLAGPRDQLGRAHRKP